MKRYLILTALLLAALLAPRTTAAQTATPTATATTTSTATATITSTATATATTPPISWYATTEAGQDYRIAYSINAGEIAFFVAQLIAVGLFAFFVFLSLRE